jgi:hypothetical protein
VKNRLIGKLHSIVGATTQKIFHILVPFFALFRLRSKIQELFNVAFSLFDKKSH